MRTVYKHESELYSHNFAVTVFEVIYLLAIGLLTLVYNINGTMANFEYVLATSSLAFVLIVPILTMSSISEERRQRTDQLLYSLPLSMWQIVGGKYLALIRVFFIPFIITCFYPLIFRSFGNVPLLAAYCALIAFFLLGAALISIGMFISSLTESQGLAAIISAAFFIFNYYSVNLAEYVSTSLLATIITLTLFNAIVLFVVKWFTKSWAAGGIFGGFLEVVMAILLLIKPEICEGLIPTVMTKLCLFEAFYSFVNGVFDISGIIYFLSIIGLFLFITVQSLEKRRYN